MSMDSRMGSPGALKVASIFGRLSGERLAIYLMCLFLGGWLLTMVVIQGYLIAEQGIGSGLDGGGHVPAEIAQKYGTNDARQLMAITNKVATDRNQAGTFVDDLVVYVRAVLILFALTAFWYFVVSRITPFRGSTGRSTEPAQDYPLLQRFTLTCDVILFAWIVLEGAFIIPFMMLRYGLHY